MASPPAESDYLRGLRAELVGKKGADKAAIETEIKRVGGTVAAEPPFKNGGRS